ncbi:uncharacterized protein B0H18DRAFT_1105518 [Fomitopsis serialis]|uniref:uncharacterized protein n=1 Tax=Fomitopsis serialis TaxID=139415 RepID=UPI002007792E|nr:uncharacterized protein B0H18DRAFT_1105518 [Neoantrodia serialis]KAH9922594.1 hypothetical protein B0H18DRAFT_1105518 [Neoantrodia serialis]
MGREDVTDISSSPAQASPEVTGIGHRMCYTTINNLPQDVFLIIFCMLSRPQWSRTPTVVSGTTISGWEGIELDPWPSSDILNPEHPFPDGLASVCRLWQATLSSVSKFWNRLVIWVGRNPTPLSKIRSYLAWSQNRPIKIYIVRRFDMSMEDPMEKAQVAAVMEELIPHMQRWKILCIKVLHSSSLPLPRVDLVGHADKLSQLTLDFVVDDSVASDGTASPLVGELHAPNLSTLFMSGIHFRELFVKPFPQSLLPPALQYLIISEYDSMRHPPFLLSDLLTCLMSHTWFGSVVLANLDLDLSYDGPPILPPFSDWCANRVGFVDMSGDVIAQYYQLLRFPWAETVHYVRCSMDTVEMLGKSYYLKLEEIANLAALVNFLINEQGQNPSYRAWFRDCDALCQPVLSALTQPVGHGVWLCPDLCWLAIEGCKRFQSSDLRMMLEARRDAHATIGFADDGHPEYVVTSVKYLDVQNCCELAPEDKEWLDENVNEVCWDDWSGGCGGW